jgi:hypothetical protein
MLTGGRLASNAATFLPLEMWLMVLAFVKHSDEISFASARNN